MPYVTKFKKRELPAVLAAIQNAVYLPLADLDVTAWLTAEPAGFADRCAGVERGLKPGDAWGGLFDCAWMHFTGRVPSQAAGHAVVLLIDVNGELCLFDQDGCPRQGLTTVNSEYDFSLGKPGKRVVPLADCAAGGEAIDVWADAGNNDLFGRLQGNGTLKEACVAICQTEVRALAYDFEVLHELMQQLPEDSARWNRIWAALDQAVLALNRLDDEEARHIRAILAPELAKQGGDPSLLISAVGHAHIDLGWLWPIRETIRKGARTFATALRFMERYPDYVFGASQAQLYLWMKERYPALYAQVKRRVAEGRWDVQGAMWVEADANVSGGEALVRQMLYGKRFFRAEFGVDIDNVWLPDVFGYSGALPQMMKKAGVDTFMTQKLSWSEINRHPHHSFWWQGIDGTRVLAHMAPEDTYNSSAAPRAIARAERNYLDKSVSEHCLLIFGIGDGGGGPGEEHLERLAREKNLQGLSPVVQEPAARFFQRLAAESSRFAAWSGELYLERHQGTYTTQARNKRFNRKMELALRDAEWLSARALWETGRPYPAGELLDTWREMLLYQFHDILPGSSITRVYDESRARYAVLLEQARQWADQAEASLAERADTAGLLQPAVVTNTLSWDRREFVQAGGDWLAVDVPACGYAVVDAGAAGAYPPPAAGASSLENEALRVTFNPDGSISSVYDKENQREALAPGDAGNRLAVYQDPGDAWDIWPHYDERPVEYFSLVSAEACVDGPRAILRQVYRHGRSELAQDVILTAGSRRLDFVTRVAWHERHRMLRVSFPVNVQADEATFEIQYGHVRRPAHRNTTWDVAKFEVCAHKWIDLSDRGYGVALLNDCKYGHKVLGNVLDLDLLRSPTSPDPVTDQGDHEFTYALLPHAGDYAAGQVVRRAYELNVPLRARPVAPAGGSAPRVASALRVDAPNVVVEALKKAEDNDDWIVRLYEAHGAAVRATVTFGFMPGSVSLVNLMEESPQPLALVDSAVTVDFGPFEIHTLRIARP